MQIYRDMKVRTSISTWSWQSNQVVFVLLNWAAPGSRKKYNKKAKGTEGNILFDINKIHMMKQSNADNLIYWGPLYRSFVV